jgi:hypothetical protein
VPGHATALEAVIRQLDRRAVLVTKFRAIRNREKPEAQQLAEELCTAKQRPEK